MKALLVYSGGMDSTVLLHEYKDEIKLCVSFNYGSKHNDREFAAAKANADALNIPIIRIDLPFINEHFKSDLLKSGGDIPDGHYEHESMKRTVVPFRNGIMLSIAAGLAESHGLESILIANHAGDHAIYSDCRPAFISAMDMAMMVGTTGGVELCAPYTNITKRDIALKGRALGVDFTKTYSCYKGGEVHCGVCGTDTERREALQGFDPTRYLDAQPLS